MQRGTLYTKAAAFRALTSLALTTRNRAALYDRGAVGLAMWHIYVSKSVDLLQVLQ